MNYKFRKKPVVIEAFQMTKERQHDRSDWPSWLFDAWKEDSSTDAVALSIMEVSLGDWIIRGVKGEVYPCKPDIFASNYEGVDVIDTKEELLSAQNWKARQKIGVLEIEVERARKELKAIYDGGDWTGLKRKCNAMVSEVEKLREELFKKDTSLNIALDRKGESMMDADYAEARGEELVRDVERKWKPLLAAADDVVSHPEEYFPGGDVANHCRLEVLQEKVMIAKGES